MPEKRKQALIQWPLHWSKDLPPPTHMHMHTHTCTYISVNAKWAPVDVEREAADQANRDTHWADLRWGCC